jgi:hypothetical protein
MRNWRNILSWKQELKEFKVGAMVRTLHNHTSGAFPDVTIPEGTIGVIGSIDPHNENSVWVYLDWMYPSPFTYNSILGVNDGWWFKMKELELV